MSSFRRMLVVSFIALSCLSIATGLQGGVRFGRCAGGTIRRSSLLLATKGGSDNEPPLVIDGSAEYYKGMLTSNDPKDGERDNVTPNLRFAGIFVVLLSGLFYGFVEANKNIPPPPF